MASHFSKKKAAVEDESCAIMFEGLLNGNQYSEIPNIDSVNSYIEERKKYNFKYLDHYWNDLNLAMTIDQVSIVLIIIKENKELVQFMVN